MKALLIAEKPSLMRTIQSAYRAHRAEFTDDIDFMAQAGHLIGLKTPKEIDANAYGKWDIDKLPLVYPYEYRVNTGKQKLINDIKHAIQSGQYDYVIHAGDPDQEGELLVSELLEYIGNTLPVKRYWSNDQTEEAVIDALHHLKDDAEYRRFYHAALARQHADYQFGMNCTSAISIKMGQLCKAGRVKAALITLLSKRELEIQNYVETTHYKPSFDYQNCEFVWDQVFEKREDCLRVLPNTDKAVIQDVKITTKHHKAPKLFRLSTLQQEMSAKAKWSAKKTLSVLQTLYEGKYTSYPRTDCEYISTNEDIGGIAKALIPYLHVDIAHLQKSPDEILADKTYCNDKAIASEGHTGIIPTGKIPTGLNADQSLLYEVICRRFLAMFGGNKVTETTKVLAIPHSDTHVYEYKTTIDLDIGYEVILHPGYQPKLGNGVVFEKGQTIEPIVFKPKEIVSKPPSRYTDGSIIKALDNPGEIEDEDGKLKFKIGTPATRANIIEDCIENGYFLKKAAKFYATDKALSVYQTFQHVPLFDLTESGNWERILSNVRENELSFDDAEEMLLQKMITSTQDIIHTECAKLAPAGATVLGKCPKCGSDIITGKFGAFCSSKCGMNVQKAYGKDLSEKQIRDLLEGKKILVKGLVSKKTGKKYDAYLIPQGIQTYEYNGKTGYSFQFSMEFPQR